MNWIGLNCFFEGPQDSGNFLRLTIAGSTITLALRAIEMMVESTTFFAKYGINSYGRCVVHYNAHANVCFLDRSDEDEQQGSEEQEVVDSDAELKKKKKESAGYFALALAMRNNLKPGKPRDWLMRQHDKECAKLGIDKRKENQRRLWLLYLLQTLCDLLVLKAAAYVYLGNQEWFDGYVSEHYSREVFFGIKVGVMEEFNALFGIFQVQYLTNRFNCITQLIFGDCVVYVENSQHYAYLARSPRDFWTRQTRHQRKMLTACVFKPVYNMSGKSKMAATIAVFLANCMLHVLLSVETHGTYDVVEWMMGFSVIIFFTILQIQLDGLGMKRMLPLVLYQVIWFVLVHVMMQMLASCLLDAFPFGLRSSVHYLKSFV